MERAIAAVAIVVAVAIASALISRIVFVREYEAGLLYRAGRFARRLGPGARIVFPFWEEVVVVDLRKRIATIPGQEVLSADNVGLKVSVAAEYQVADPVRAVHEAQSYEEALHVAIQLALRAAVGAAKIDDLLAQRTKIGKRLADAVALQVEALGLRLHVVEVKDVMFPGELKKIFAEVVRAQKEGQAALERARRNRGAPEPRERGTAGRGEPGAHEPPRAPVGGRGSRERRDRRARCSAGARPGEPQANVRGRRGCAVGRFASKRQDLGG
jgi:regulator of protease activity HflC (stomatin/prohibitin superfamily)